MTNEKIELIPNQESQPQQVTDEIYKAFIARFQAQVKPDLDKFREARRQSEEEAKRRFVY